MRATTVTEISIEPGDSVYELISKLEELDNDALLSLHDDEPILIVSDAGVYETS